MISKIPNYFKNFSLILLLVFLIIIFISACLNIENISFINNLYNPYIILILATIIITLPIINIFKKIDNTDEKKLKIFKITFFTILFIFQIIFLIIFSHSTQSTDANMVLNEAASIANNKNQIIDYNFSNYFKIYLNNNFFLLLNIYFFKILNIFGITSYLVPLYIFNMILINLGIYLTYKTAKLIKNEKFAVKVLLLSILNPLNYLFIAWPYTLTFSLPCIIGLLYFTLKLKKETEKKNIIKYSIIIGLLTSLGYLLRPIIIIPITAIIICILLNPKKIKNNIKKICFISIIISIAFLSSFFIINTQINKIAPNKENAFPITHWIMMGLHGNGTVNNEDNNLSISYKTTDKIKKANIEEIKSTLDNYQISGLIKHLLIKLPITWADGISSYPIRIGQGDNHTNSLYEWIIGDKNTFITVYCQAYRILLLFLTIISTISIIKSKNKDKFVFYLTILGAIVFYLIWEAKNLYSYPFLTLFTLLSANGLDILLKKKNKDSAKISIMVLCIIYCLFSVSYLNNFTKDKYTFKNYNIKIFNPLVITNIDNLSKKTKPISMEFESKNSFNHVLFYVENLTDDNKEYNIKLLNKKGKTIYNTNITSKDIVTNSYINLNIDKNLNEHKYKIIITNIDNSKDTINWKLINDKYFPTYNGKLYLDGKVSNKKLYIETYNETYNAFMNKTFYILLNIIIILFIISNYIYYKKMTN